ncbi:unnamed protein product [Heligmosomoides polygyrus]|uniref:7TM_GPCR_Srx domain-containing protein n=1 Tax=Heligmosomoides polygyrus TaxID=6339 RepID=A0A183F7L9_HELPZ|nr:unnamed protein product [Heligmosomoides polygyrus]
MVLVFFTQMTAAYCSYFLAKAFWRLQIHPVHAQFVIGRAFDKYVCDFIEDTWTCSLVACTFSGFVCALGINYTGMYANPLVAWACTFNCEGVTHVGHLLVYWLSPLIGW